LTKLSPSQLAVARKWPAERSDELTTDELKWISYGIFWQRARIIAAVTILLFVAGLALVAAVNWRKAVNERRIATARAVLALAQTEEQRNTERALAMALQAYDMAAQLQGLRVTPFENAVRRTLSESRVRQTIELPDKVTWVAWHPTEPKFATVSELSGVRMWSPETGKAIGTAIVNTYAYSVRWSPSGKHLGLGLVGSISCWTDNQQDVVHATEEGWKGDISWSRDEKRLAGLHLHKFFE
jgi:hypothetical protein